MRTSQIIRITKKFADLTKQPYEEAAFVDQYYNNENFENDLEVFIDTLTDQCQRLEMILLRHEIPLQEIESLILFLNTPLLFFANFEHKIHPILFFFEKKQITCLIFDNETEKKVSLEEIKGKLISNNKDILTYLTPFPLPPMISEPENKYENKASLSPLTRFFRLLSSEKREIAYLYFYALMISLISLTLPLGIQSIMEYIAGGIFFSSIFILIGIVILGVLVTGILQVMQYSIVEVLQRRIFVKAALEFSYRITRIRAEAVEKYYTPELMNRFFEVLTIQKGLTKILIDMTGAVMQILFGLLLLNFYHPFFIFFGASIVGTLVVILYFTSQTGMRTNIIESKYKYKVVHWLEEVARTLNTFKMAGHTSLPIARMEATLNNYLQYRKKHFKVLMIQYINIIGFKTIVTGGLLIIGCFLVVNREITVGQFIASEIVIIMILGAVEKVIQNMSTVYDILTAVDKIGYVTDLPLEKTWGIHLPSTTIKENISLKIRNLSYKYKDSDKIILKGVNLDIKAGERICITGLSGSGKNTLIEIIAGILDTFEGSITLNNMSLRDLNRDFLRDIIGKNVSIENIFDGTILENINMGKSSVSYNDVVWAVEKLALADYVNALPDGLLTEIMAGGKQFSSSVIIKIILARTIAKHPKLLILNDFLHDLNRDERLKIINFLLDKKNKWTMLCISNEPSLLASCDRVVILDDGQIVGQGTYQELLQNPIFQKILVGSGSGS